MSAPDLEAAAAPSRPRWAYVVGLAVGASGTVALAAAAVMGRPTASVLRDPSPALIAVTVVVVAFALFASMGAPGWYRHLPVAAGLGTAAVLGWSAIQALVDQHETGFPQARSSWIIVGAALAFIGLAIAWSSGPPTTLDGLRPRVLVATPIPVAVAVAASVGLSSAVSPSVIHSTTASADVEIAPVPGELTEVAWQTELPGQPYRLVPAGAGLIAVLDDGVVALDGVTGGERWHYRRDVSTLVGADVTPDGRTVVIEVSDPFGRDDVVVLDGLTGEVRHSGEHDGGSLALSNDAAASNQRDGSIVGRDLDTWDRRWQVAESADCPDSLRVHGSPSGIIVPCAGDRDDLFAGVARRLLLLDGQTGEVRWRFDGPFDVHSIAVSPDGQVVAVDPNSEQDSRRSFIDIATGEALETPSELEGIALAFDGDGYSCSDGSCGFVDLATGETRTLDDVSGGRLATIPGGFVLRSPEDVDNRAALVHTFHGPPVEVRVEGVEASYPTTAALGPGALVIAFVSVLADGTVTTFVAGVR